MLGLLSRIDQQALFDTVDAYEAGKAEKVLVLDGFDGAVGDDEAWPDEDRTVRADMGDSGPETNRTEDLHDGANAHHLHRDQGALDDQSSDNTPDSIGARIARIRRTVGDGLRELGQGIARLGETLEKQDRKQGEWLGALSERRDADLPAGPDAAHGVFVQTTYRMTLYKHPTARNHKRNSAMNASLGRDK